MKKILGFILCGVMCCTLLTGCGNERVEYSENMKEMRSITIGYLDNNTLGSLLDKAIENADWEEDANYSVTTGAIIVTGTDKSTGDSIELIWLTNSDNSEENGFESFTIDNTNMSYSEFLEYLKGYVTGSDANTVDDNNGTSDYKYEAEEILHSILNDLANEYQLNLTIEQFTSALNEKNYQLLDNTGSVINETGILFDEDGAKIYALLRDDKDNIYSFYATYENGNVIISQFKKER